MIKELLSSCWSLIKAQTDHFGIWVVLSLISYLCIFTALFTWGVCSAVVMIQVSSVLGRFFIATVCVASLVLLLRYVVSYFNVLALNALDAAHGRTLRKFEHGVNRMATLGVVVSYVALISIGSVFLIIPGLVFAVRFSLAYLVMLEQGTTVWQSLILSWDLTRGYFVPVAVLLLVISLESCIPFLNLIFPVPSFCMANLYVQLNQRKLTATIN